MDLREFFRRNPKIAVAFSGGVDSSYLLYAAKHYGAEVKGYFVKSEFQPQFELEDALAVAAYSGAEMEILTLSALSDEEVRKNPKNRCYYCKKHIFSSILEHAAADGFPVIIDGTNASDDIGDRPGSQALQEMKVLSPLRLCGLTKSDVRRLSR
ncbi:MAG: TIGR00268 family protein, partial [Spirochaetales bacterium]|nr:TIGR00268 family protein [Candidatus Physcosoma equi]